MTEEELLILVAVGGTRATPVYFFDSQYTAPPVSTDALLLESGGANALLLESGGSNELLLEA